jgi:Cation-channel complex subunit UNC-79
MCYFEQREANIRMPRQGGNSQVYQTKIAVKIIPSLRLRCLNKRRANLKYYSDSAHAIQDTLFQSTSGHNFVSCFNNQKKSSKTDCAVFFQTAVALCFSRECTSYNSNRPVRLCNTCNKIRHNTRRGADHVVHASLPSPWDMEPETQV